jgi:hypothetical protein
MVLERTKETRQSRRPPFAKPAIEQNQFSAGDVIDTSDWLDWLCRASVARERRSVFTNSGARRVS